ncbi:hypothetical protein BOTBODRAFT_192294 [Botryobasidium botryosum FD-172 SS1]|uniref:F-box domain-containing protein n=1 Tax=Botryobasidium botryosum (strain FD-172 SS1) TaxID=930990 RepID=A0A067M712_BOTB1|nr:hypothetical protein BOTBODRAFT_192294 [Botryobasidium botryosum FD-172 SS1]
MEGMAEAVDQLLGDISQFLQHQYANMSELQKADPGGVAFRPLEELFKYDQISAMQQYQLYALSIAKRRAIAEIESSFAKNLRACYHTIQPISRLPTEVLSLIFEFATSPTSEETCLYFAPTLARVSKRWRNIAQHTPSIWGMIDDRSVDAYLPLSKGSPLRVVFKAHPDPDGVAYSAFMDKVSSTAHRWISLKLESYSIVSPQHFSVTAPRLTALYLDTLGTFRFDYKPGVQLLTTGYSKLRSLHLAGICLPLDPAPLFAGLQTLHLERIRFRSSQFPGQLLARAISASSELRDFSLAHIITYGAISQENREALKSPIDLSLLQTLRFTIVDSHIVCAILGSIAVPTTLQLSVDFFPILGENACTLFPKTNDTGKFHLSNLSLARSLKFSAHSGGWRMEAWDEGGATKLLDLQCTTRGIDSLARFIQAFGCHIPSPPIHSLYISGFSAVMETDEFADFLAQFPNLSRLTLHRCSSAFVNVLSTTLTPSRRYCPFLTHLRIEECHDVREEALLRMLVSRVRGHLGRTHPIRVLDIVQCEGLRHPKYLRKSRLYVKKLNHKFTDVVSTR